MKKKFITGLLLMAVTAGGFSTLTSCKDTEEDLFAKIEGEQASLNADLSKLDAKLLKDIADALTTAQGYANDALKDAKDYADDKKHYTDDEIKTLVQNLLNTWSTSEAANPLQQSITTILTQMGYTPGGGGGTGTSCDCALKDLTAEQAQTLIALIGQAKALLGDGLDGTGGILGEFAGLKTTVGNLNTNLGNLQTTVTTLSTNFQTLDKVVNGDPAVPGSGLVNQLSALSGTVSTIDGKVSTLEEWFKDFTDEKGNPMTPATFQDYVKQGAWVKAHSAALEQIEAKSAEIALLDKAAIEALNKVAADLEGIDKVYNDVFVGGTLPEGETAFWKYTDVMQKIIDNSKAIEILQDNVDKLFGRINDMVTSLVLQAAVNNVYPSFNTPFGINSMVLMAYFGNLATDAESFPVSNAKDMGAEMYADYNVDWTGIVSDPYQFKGKILAPMANDTEASLGNLWFTVNPGTVSNLKKDGFAIVNSRDDEPVVKLTNITKDDETLLKFGINGSGSRAGEGNGNGLYVGEATVALENLDNIKITIEDGLKQSLVDAVKNRKAADMAHLLKVLYNQVQDLCDANALRYTYNAITGKDNNGNYTSEPSKVYSNYGLAATAFKPLSFATLKGTSIRHLPNLGKIEIDKDLVNLNLKPFVIGDVELNVSIQLGSIEIDPVGDVWVEYQYPDEFGPDGQIAHMATDKINIGGKLNDVIGNIQASIDKWIKGNGDEKGLDDKIKDAISTAVNTAFNGPDGMIAKIENQVNDMMGDIQNKLNDLVGQINNDYLGKVNKLIDKYNSVADRINGMLDDPNHYLQSVMFYGKADGGIGFLSTDYKQPTQFKGNGEAIELIATTYNFEVICPVYKKIVGVTKVTNQDGTENTALKQAANETIAKVVDGGQNRFALDVKGAKNGVFTYEIAYQALDYTGHTSTVKTYIQVVRK